MANVNARKSAMDALERKVHEAGSSFNESKVSHRKPEKEGGFHKLVITVEISVKYRPTICDR